jgi:signal transduction histidine kinase
MEKSLKILMLEDVPDDAGLIERALKKQGINFLSKRVDTRDEFRDALSVFHPDVILSDHALPQFNSQEALSICQQHGINVPFILVTGAVSEEFAVSCLKQGADDYVLKSNMVRLPSAIKNAIRQRAHDDNRRKAEQTLRLQNEQLTKINKELDSFVYSVSHNLRAPLMSVLGLLNLVQLENAAADPRLKGYFEMMQHSIHKLDETLKEILDYSRNARSELNIQRVDFEKLLDEGFERLMYLEGSDQIEKKINVQSESPLFSDSYRIGVILNNLISNAIKYRDNHKAKSTIEIQVVINEKQLQIIFRDNGIGIDASFTQRIFDMFFRATERSEGAGLGLYIVKETIEKLGGAIAVESSVGVGSTFKISIPNNTPTS